MSNIYNILINAWRDLSDKKASSVLTSLGIIIAIAGVITIVGVMTGFERGLVKNFKALGTETIIIKPNMYLWLKTGRNSPLTNKQLDAITAHISGISKVVAFSPFSFPKDGLGGTQLKFGRITAYGSIIASSDALPTLTGRYPIAGRFLAQSDSSSRRRVCLISNELAKKLNFTFGKNTQYIQVANHMFQVIGIMPGSSRDLLKTSADVYISLGVAKQLNSNSASLRIGFRIEETRNAVKIRNRVTNVLRQSQQTPPAQPDSFIIEDANEIKALSKEVFSKITIVLLIIVSISLITGGIGIMNVMLASVNERTREIGLLRALGATKNYIRMKFLIESMLLTLVGSIIGIFVGWLGSIIVSVILHSNGIVIPAWSVALSVIFSMFIGFVCGLAPANKAANLSPITALNTN